MGEDILFSRTIEIQVGTRRHTTAHLETGPCTTCHTGPSALGNILHANDNRAACAGCHAPLGFELEGPIFVRTHFIHSRSNRFDAPLTKCVVYRLTEKSIQPTSKAACLSCHQSYLQSHIEGTAPSRACTSAAAPNRSSPVPPHVTGTTQGADCRGNDLITAPGFSLNYRSRPLLILLANSPSYRE
jgi:predicted CXXCH cytochrome family protein